MLKPLRVIVRDFLYDILDWVLCGTAKEPEIESFRVRRSPLELYITAEVRMPSGSVIEAYSFTGQTWTRLDGSQHPIPQNVVHLLRERWVELRDAPCDA